MDRKLMVLGAGIGQLPAIEEAKNMGVTTIAVDMNPEAVGMSVADFSYDTDITDFEGVLSIAKKHKIEGAITLQSDVAIPVLGKANDLLGLNGISEQVAKWCSNKIASRKKFKEKNISQPQFAVVNDFLSAKNAVNKIGYPCIVKASDSSGSRGVRKISSDEQIKAALNKAQKYTNSDKILIEEYIDGLEFGAQTFSKNGNCEILLLHNDSLSSPPYMIPVGHSFPFTKLSGSDLRKAKENIKKGVETIGIKEGPANVDVILDKSTNEVKIIEIGARIGATCLPELVYYHTGINWIQEAIRSALRLENRLLFKVHKPVAAHIITSPKDGIFNGYHFKNKIDKTSIIEFNISVGKGEKVSKLRKGTDRIGKVITTGVNAKDAEEKCRNVLAAIEFHID